MTNFDYFVLLKLFFVVIIIVDIVGKVACGSTSNIEASGGLMKGEVEVKAKKIYQRKLFKRIVKIVLLLLLTLVSVIYLFLYIVYEGGRFTVTLDKNLSNRKNVYLS